MNQSSHHRDEDQDSLFGSPPPSPARGRSPSQEERFIVGDQVGPVIAVPSTGAARKNVGTIALPGSHMSCAELPANLPASSLSLPRPTPSHSSPTNTPPSAGHTAHTPMATSRSPSHIVSSRRSSATSIAASASSSSAKRRRTSKAKSLTPAPPPIPLPGPDEPTPPNFLRSQSTLLGLAGLVGSVKPAQLYTHTTPPTQQSPIRGSTPANPIVLEDDQDTPEQPSQSPRPDQLNPEQLRSNILNSLMREKNIFPVLESLIKLLGGDPRFPTASLPPQSFSRPYGHVRPSAVAPPLASTGSIIPTIPPLKRRKLRHVPAGAVDWDIPFPFAAGEGPEGYRDTWARDRAKQLVTQLLDLIQNATRRATIKTAKSMGTVSEGWTRPQAHQSSRSASVETQISQAGSTLANIRESSLHANVNPECAATETPSTVSPVDSLSRFLDSLESPSMVGSPAPDVMAGISAGPELEGMVEEGSSATPCDYSAFEEWLSQLQQFVPLETNASTLESGRGALLDLSTLGPTPNASTQSGAGADARTIHDEVIDPTLLGISHLGASGPRSSSPISPAPALASSDIPIVLDPSVQTMPSHSLPTSLSSLREPLTPLSEPFGDPPTGMMVRQDLDRDPPVDQPIEKEHSLQSLLIESFKRPWVQKGKVQADGSDGSVPLSTSGRSAPSVVPGSKVGVDKQAILQRARERRKEFVAEIEQAKIELWETSVENAVLVHLMRDESLCP